MGKHEKTLRAIFATPTRANITMMQYKGYLANVAFDDANDLFHGEIVGIRDVVTFSGTFGFAELRQALAESVEDYLDFCRQRGESPEKPLSGRFVLRISSRLHRSLCAMATQSGQSLNAWIAARLESEAERFSSPARGSKRSRTAKKAGRARK